MTHNSLADIVRAGLGARPNDPFPWALYHDDGCGKIIVRINCLPSPGKRIRLADHHGRELGGSFMVDAPPRGCPHCAAALTAKDWRIECVREHGL